MKVFIWGLLVVAAVLGAATTAHYLELLPPDSRAPWGLLAVGFVLTACFTLGNLLLRWMRWHFLTRRFALFFRTRESIKLYFATLPLLAVPAFLGELLRPWTISGRDPRARWVVLQVWFLERGMDVSVVALWWLIGLQVWPAVLAVALSSWIVVSAILTYFERRRGNPRPRRDALVFAAAVYGGSALAWLLPSAALFGVLWMLDGAASVYGVLEAFSAGTLLGGLTGLPLGTGVTGAQTVERLVASGSSTEYATWAVLVLRSGTAWFAVALGAALLFVWRRRLPLLSTDESSAHFDALAPEYGTQIPEHMRQRLLRRKTDVMLHYFQDRGRDPHDLCGLDFGCGQGWYAAEMALQGFDMCGTDASSGQLEQARVNADHYGIELELRQNERGRIPFDDNTFDFIYTINVIHHVLDEADRKSLFADFNRILKPGGVIFLHEINTLNPLFRFYMSYVFPLLRRIDEGTERWINPKALPPIPGGSWGDVSYFTFLPDFVPQPLVRLLRPFEAALERSFMRHLSAHYVAFFEKEPEAGSVAPVPSSEVAAR